MNKLCCQLNPWLACSECKWQQCRTCWDNCDLPLRIHSSVSSECPLLKVDPSNISAVMSEEYPNVHILCEVKF